MDTMPCGEPSGKTFLARYNVAMRLRLFVPVLLLAGTMAMAAGTPSEPRFPGAAVIPRPELKGRSVARQARAGDPGVGLFAAAQPAWWVAASPLSGSVARAFGPGLALAGDPGDGLAARGRAWLGYGELLRGRNDEEALLAGREALSLASGRVDAIRLVARALLALGRADEARQALETHLEFNPTHAVQLADLMP